MARATAAKRAQGAPVEEQGDRALGARQAAILEAVVTEYIGTAQPVGSQHVAQAAAVKVSSATVRSEMAALEQEGYLVQPHTSAGRVPTDKGYRFFVDHLTGPGVLGPPQRLKVIEFFDQVHGEMEELLERTSGLLADVTSCAAVVVGPGHEAAAIRSVQLVSLAPGLVLVVVVLADGAVEKRAVDVPGTATEEELGRAGAILQLHGRGQTLSEVGPPPPTGDVDLDRVVAVAGSAMKDMASSRESEHVFVGGPSRLAEAFDAMETVRSVLAILEQQLVVVSLLRDVLDRGLSVAIGTEHGYESLASCAVVVAPVWVEGHDAGAVGLVGPTRMNYPQALAAARVVGEHLGERLADALGMGHSGDRDPATVAESSGSEAAGEPGRRSGRRSGGARRGRS